MKKIDEQVKNAVANWKAMHGKNTKVRIVFGMLKVYLHGNLIFWAESPSKWNASNCGWNTTTTRARLNACLAGIGSSLGVSSKDDTMRLVGSTDKCQYLVVGNADRFNQDAERPTKDAEVEKHVGKYSPDYVRWRVWRVPDGGARFLYGEYVKEATANSVAKKIREGVM